MKRTIAFPSGRRVVPPVFSNDRFGSSGQGIVSKEDYDLMIGVVAMIAIPRQYRPLYTWRRECPDDSAPQPESNKREAYQSEWVANIDAAKEFMSSELSPGVFPGVLESATLFDPENRAIRHPAMMFSRFEFLKVFTDELIPNTQPDSNIEPETGKLLDQLLRVSVAMFDRSQSQYTEHGNFVARALDSGKFDGIPARIDKLGGINNQYLSILETGQVLVPSIFESTDKGTVIHNFQLLYKLHELDHVDRLKERVLNEYLPNRRGFLKWDAEKKAGMTVLSLIGVPSLVTDVRQSLSDGPALTIEHADVRALLNAVETKIGDFLSDKSSARTKDATPYVVCRPAMESLLAMLKEASSQSLDGGAVIREVVSQSDLGQGILKGSEDKRFGDDFSRRVFKEFHDFLRADESAPEINPYSDAPRPSDRNLGESVQGTSAWYRNLREEIRAWGEELRQSAKEKEAAAAPVSSAKPSVTQLSRMDPAPDVEDNSPAVSVVAKPKKSPETQVPKPKKKTVVQSFKNGLSRVGRFLGRLCCCCLDVF